MYVPTFDDVKRAHERIKPFIHRTPILTSTYFNELTGADLYFKCENFQKVGAFKVRGATNAVFSLSDEEAEKGVSTHSSGNHAASLARAASWRGIPAYVVMPENAPQAKQNAVKGYGAELIHCAPSLKAREEKHAEVNARTGANFVHPYNDHRVIAGQGTCAVEILEEVGPLDAVIAPIGGGGMVSGTATTIEASAPNTKVYAAEPKAADDAYRSFKSGTLIEDDAPKTVADGLKVSLRDLTFHIVTNKVDGIFLAEEEQIISAMRLIWERMKIVVEPSSAVTLAAIIANPEPFKGQKVGVILTGGNVDMDKLPWLKK